MSAEKPLSVEEILADERRALRPDDGERGPGASGGRPLSALCLSGGGIRSATLGLGAIQGLAERGVLGQFDYLSTVSGGGYIGSWLTAWVSRAGGLENVAPRLCRDASSADGEPESIRHLREYNSYLSPRMGAMSSDLWTLVATVLRNIFLNWMVLVPLLLFGLMLPRVFLSALSFPELVYSDEVYGGQHDPNFAAPVLDAVSGSLLVSHFIPGLSVAFLAVALFFTLRYLPGVGGQDHSRFDYIRGILVPLIGAVLAFMAFDSLYYLGDSYVAESNLLYVLGWMLLAGGVAWLLNLVLIPRPLGERARLLFGPLSLAVVSMALGTGGATANQWFNESQTESYRSLGLLTIEEICQGWEGDSLESLVEHVETSYLPTT